MFRTQRCSIRVCWMSNCINFKNETCTHWWDRERAREKRRKAVRERHFHSTGSAPETTGSQELIPGFPLGWQRPNYLNLLPLRVCFSRKLSQEQGYDWNPDTDRECQSPNWCLGYLAACLLLQDFYTVWMRLTDRKNAFPTKQEDYCRAELALCYSCAQGKFIYK